MNSLNKMTRQTLASMEVAKMIEKEHHKLLRDIRRYAKQLAESKIGLGEFFQESTYLDSNNQERPCYQITKKGCEFIAHKLTGVKGTAFTAKYINRFHEMEELLKEKDKKPWYIREFRGREIVLFRDFETLTGIKLSGNYTSYKRYDRLIDGTHYNGWGWKCNNEEFKSQYGFDYGNDDCMMYLYMSGFYKALRMMKLEADREKVRLANQLLAETDKKQDKMLELTGPVNKPETAAVKISIMLNGKEIEIS